MQTCKQKKKRKEKKDDVDVVFTVFISDAVIRCKQKGRAGKCLSYSVFIFHRLLFNTLTAQPSPDRDPT